jgi:alpha-L-arabinofuranosidase
MKQLTILAFLTMLFVAQNSVAAMYNEPDSAYIIAYSTVKSGGHNGLHMAWSIDKKHWNPIGPEHRFLFSDYGRWGKEKRLVAPFLFKDNNQLWHCLWSLNEYDGVFAHATSNDLIYWKPQTYPKAMANNNCMAPEAWYDKASGLYTVTWLSTASNDTLVYGTTTNDFVQYSATSPLTLADRKNLREKAEILGNLESGTINRVPWKTIDALVKAQQLAAYNTQQANESYQDDSVRFKGIKAIEATITANVANSKQISDKLFGIFFEDINYAADGGLYAELVQNRDFEYAPSDKEGNDKTWNSTKAWHLSNDNGTLTIDTVMPIHPNNKHYAQLNITNKGTALVNDGFNGIAVKQGEKYDFSVFVRNTDTKSKQLTVRLVTANGDLLGQATIAVNATSWKKVNAVLTAQKTAAEAVLEIIPQSTGSIALDMVSLFPQKTYKGHKNGLRADLAQTIADLHPRFVRFPGGCVSHGDGLGNIYKWKNTIGALEARKPQRNLWGYHQTAGLGYFEYLQFCEDMGAEPLPVIAAGVPCQNSATGGPGQQGGVPLCDMDNYVQDILDLIEYCNGDVKTVWGKKRAEAGHPKPFNLKYIGIGNEDLINAIFEERFTIIYNAVKAKHPEITIIGTVGPFNEGTDYVEGWDIATKLGVPMVDEHYYQTPGWFINNQGFYDRYDRKKPKVYLGEYASWGNALYNALSEAIYLTGVERNGDVVSMTSYAPLLAKERFTQWHTDMIFFNNTEVKPTVNYTVQQLYGANAGNSYIESSIKLNDNKENVRKRVGVSVVRDSQTGDYIVKLANLLPVEVKTNVTVDGMGTVDTLAAMTQLSGKPGDKQATPTTTNIAVDKGFTVTLPAYSFTVVRVKK